MRERNLAAAWIDGSHRATHHFISKKKSFFVSYTRMYITERMFRFIHPKHTPYLSAVSLMKNVKAFLCSFSVGIIHDDD